MSAGPLKLEEAHAIAEVLGVEPEALTKPADDRADALAQFRAAELAIAGALRHSHSPGR